MVEFLILIVVAYLAGSVNFPIILFRITGRSDPRGQFSGNPGTTNVYRQAGPVWAATILVLDFSRAIGVSWLAITLLPAGFVPWVGLALILGNRFPCFHGFSGGKGVANYLGFFALPVGLETLYSLVAWLLAYGLFRKPFIASFFLVLILGGLISRNQDFELAGTAGVLATVLFIIFNHRRNIAELLSG